MLKVPKIAGWSNPEWWEDIGGGDLYDQYFHLPAHDYIRGREYFSMPRIKTKSGGKSIHRVYNSVEIKQGYEEIVQKHTGQLFHKKLRRTSTQQFLHQVRLKDESSRKYWMFWTYDDEAEVKWFYFDFDRHYPESPSDKVIKLQDDNFAQQILYFKHIMQELRVKPLWVTSPGDIVNGDHKQGVYAYIFLDKPIKVKHLRELLNTFLNYHHLNVEHSCDKTNRLIRLPGQRHAELCDIKINANNKEISIIKHPLIETEKKTTDNLRRYLTFNKQLYFTNTYDISIFDPKNILGQVVYSKNNFVSSGDEIIDEIILGINPKIVTQPLVITEGDKVHHKFCLSNKDNVVGLYGADEFVNYKEIKNTWTVKEQSKIHSVLAHKYSGNLDFIDLAVNEADEFFQFSRPESSKTRADGKSFHYRCLKWMFDRYDSSLCNFAQKTEDEERSQYMNKCTDNSILFSIFKNKYECTYKQANLMMEVVEYGRKHQWRISYKVLGKIFDKNTKAKSKFKKIFTILMEYKKPSGGKKGLCRQWGFKQDVTFAYSTKNGLQAFIKEIIDMAQPKQKLPKVDAVEVFVGEWMLLHQPDEFFDEIEEKTTSLVH